METFIQSIKKSTFLMSLIYSIRFVLNSNKKNVTGDNNAIKYYGALLKNVTFNIKGSNNIVTIGVNASLRGCNFNIRGDNHVIDIGKNGIYYKCNFATEDHDCIIKLGNDTTMYENCEIAAVEPFSIVEIGTGCMFSSNIDVRNTDSHSIMDTHTKLRINPGKNVKLGDRVWVGAYATILKGVTIGNDSVVGIRSLVTKDVPANTVVAGMPAKVVKSDIYWIKERV